MSSVTVSLLSSFLNPEIQGRGPPKSSFPSTPHTSTATQPSILCSLMLSLNHANFFYLLKLPLSMLCPLFGSIFLTFSLLTSSMIRLVTRGFLQKAISCYLDGASSGCMSPGRLAVRKCSRFIRIMC